MPDPIRPEPDWRFDARYTLTADDALVMLADIQHKHRPDKQLKVGRALASVAVVGSIVALLCIAQPHDGPITLIMGFVIAGLVVLFGLAGFIGYLSGNVQRYIRQQFAGDPGMIELAEQHLTADATGCVVRAGRFTTTTYNWAAFLRVTRRDGRTFLWVKRQEAVVVPDHGFDNPDDGEQFFHQVQCWMDDAEQSTNT